MQRLGRGAHGPMGALSLFGPVLGSVGPHASSWDLGPSREGRGDDSLATEHDKAATLLPAGDRK